MFSLIKQYLTLTTRMHVWLLVIALAAIFYAGRLSTGDVKLSVIIVLAALVVGLFNAWRNK